jgi:hypothetical protein
MGVCGERIETIAFPASVGVNGRWAFKDCKSLASVTFEVGSELRQIKEGALGSSGLKSIVIPASVELIGKDAFRRCESLVSVTFKAESKLRAVSGGAFEGCPWARRLNDQSCIERLPAEIQHHDSTVSFDSNPSIPICSEPISVPFS